jgi:hypothetical protein
MLILAIDKRDMREFVHKEPSNKSTKKGRCPKHAQFLSNGVMSLNLLDNSNRFIDPFFGKDFVA